MLYASGFLWAWGYLVHFMSPAFFADPHLVGLGFSEGPYLASALCGYGAAVVLSEWRGREAVAALSWAGCLAMVLGSLALGSRVFPFPHVGWIVEVGSVMAGAGMAVCTTAWGVCLTLADSDDLERTALSWCFTFAAIVVAAGLVSSLDGWSRLLTLGLLVALPVLSQIGLWGSFSCLRLAPDSDEQSEFADPERARGKLNDLATLVNLLCAFLSLSFIWSAVSSLQRSAFSAAMFVFALAAVMLWAVLWLALRYTRRFGLSTLYRWALPLTLGGIACASLGYGPFMSAAFVMVLVVDLGFEIVAKLFFVYTAKRWRGHEVLPFALGMAVINVAGLAGSLLWANLKGFMDVYGFPVLMLFALIPFVVAVALAFGNSRDSVVRNNAGEGETEGVDGLGSSCASGAESRDRLGAKLEAAYRLTPREAEVVVLLAQGRSRSYVRETLFISKGTVDTHAYHAYAKMGIRTKDELMRLVDEL